MTIIPARREGETELAHLKRKELCWGLWQGDALERMAQQDQTISALQARIVELEATLRAVKAHAQALSVAIVNGMAELKPDDLAIDHAPHINAMAAAGCPEYLRGVKPSKHKDLRAAAGRTRTAKETA